jgi:cytochrome d ubiquinol oxidase subunit II
MFQNLGIVKLLALAVAVAGVVIFAYGNLTRRYGRAFLGTSIAIAGTVATMFATLFPRVMPSSLGEAFDLTIYNASSSDYTLQVMTVVALTLVPIVLGYQAWSYWVFRKRLTTESKLEY